MVRKENDRPTVPVWIAGTCIACIVAAFAAYVLLFPSVSPRDIARISVVVVSDPIHVVSLDRQTDELRILTIPADVSVDAVHGYGRYSLEALWKLGSIEKKEGIVLAESLEESIGLPIPYYIGRRDQEFFAGSNPAELVDNVFSIRGLLTFLRGGYKTNIPAREFLAIMRARSESLSRNQLITDLAESRVLASEILPDGASVRVLDTEILDQIVQADYELTRIRDERLSVSVFNTTESPALGSRVARLLGHLGIHTVSVGNDTPSLDTCRITGMEEALQTFTAQVIARLYTCERVSVESLEKSDLELRIGKAYQARFFPFVR